MLCMVSWCLCTFSLIMVLMSCSAQSFSDQSLRTATLAGAHPDSPSKRAMVKRAADVDGQDCPRQSERVRDCKCVDECLV